MGEIAGPYRLEIRSSSPKAPPGRYEIKIKELRTATEKDKHTVTGSRIVAAASQLERQGSADSFRQAIAQYHEVLPIWKLAGLRLWEATVLYLIANDYVFLGEKQKALESATSAVEVAQAAAKEADNEERTVAVKVEANALDVMGRVHNELGDKKKALEYFNQALPLHKSIGNRQGELTSVTGISTAYQYMGDFQRALTVAEEASRIAKELGDQAKAGLIFNNICVIHENLGDLKQALDYCCRALAIRHDANEAIGVIPYDSCVDHLRSILL